MLKIVVPIISFLFLIAIPCLAQNNDSIILPSPQIGWDSLQKKIHYPTIAKRAVIWGAYEIKLEIDSTGKMVEFNLRIANYEIEHYKYKITDDYHVFYEHLIEVFSNLIWNPGQINDEPKTMGITIPIVFYFNERRGAAPTLFINSKPSYPN